ncbi:Cell Wall Hydrolase [Cohaesibacter sp. ES.047]|nr:Cell Wall Hydrolase [Cohaesibacter sp. ES.047]
MSNTKLGKNSLGLTARILLGSGLVLVFTQSLDEAGTAGPSVASLNQQAWTREVFAGNLLEHRGTSKDILAPKTQDTGYGRSSARLQATAFDPTKSNQSAYIRIAETSNTSTSVETLKLTANSLSDLKEAVHVSRKGKSDRRLGWGWEPFKVGHGRRAIALNWSGSLWSMSGPFEKRAHEALPKQAFAPSDDLKLVMADASKFLPPEPLIAPTSMVAKAEIPANSAIKAEQRPIADTAALAYAPNSAEALEAPFEAILTEQRKGQISEDNQVTVLSAVEQINGELDEDDATSALATLSTLPRSRAPVSTSSDTDENKVSKPLDTSPLVASLEALPKNTGDETATQNEGLTLAMSKARRAELKLASLTTGEDEEPKKRSRFARWFGFGGPTKAKIDPKGEHAWITNKLPKSSFSKKQKTCLANAIYFESRSEPEKGQIAVAQVVVNRVKNPTYPNSICGVVYQNQHKRNRCQFSFACDRIPDRVRSKKAWDTAWKIANQVVKQEVWLKEIGSSTHYHATYVHPRWARTMKRLDKIGLHIFYKTYGGGWS